MQNIVLVVISCVLTAIGQIAFKKGMEKFAEEKFEVSTLPHTLMDIFLNPIIILGFACFGSGAVVWLFALAKLELSYAVPLSGLTYILILIAGILLFKEPLTTSKVVGTICVAAGIGILSIR
jgi:drug/metabolite transporter (DMT)-like permease